MGKNFNLVHATYSNLININSTEVPEVSYLVNLATKFNIPTEVETIKRLLVDNSLDNDAKIKLLTTKLEGIWNGDIDIPGRSKFIILALVSLIVTFSFSGLTGLAIFLEALYKLLKEGKISKILYQKLS